MVPHDEVLVDAIANDLVSAPRDPRGPNGEAPGEVAGPAREELVHR